MKNTSAETDSVYGWLGVLLILAVPFVFAYSVWSTAVVAVYLWSWFVVPLFHLPALTLAPAFGLVLTIKYFSYNPVSAKTEDEREIKTKIVEFITLCLYPWMVMLMGWGCHRFFM